MFIIGWDFDLQLLAFISVGTNYHTVFWTVANNDTSFSGSWQTLTVKYYKFPFNTFFLARFRDCSLLELYLLVLFHDSPCEFLMCPYYRTISRFSLYCRIRFCFSYIIINYMFYKGAKPLQSAYLIHSILYYINLDFLDYEVCVWTSVSFEYSPFIATLSDFANLTLYSLTDLSAYISEYNVKSICTCGAHTFNQLNF